MRIAILLRILWTGGAQKIAISEARSLQEMGHSVRLVFLRGSINDEYKDLLQEVEFEIVSKGRKSVFDPVYSYVTGKFIPDRKKEGRVDYGLLRKFPNYIRKNKFDIIICHDQWAGLGGYYARKKLGISYKVMIHEKLLQFQVPILGFIATMYERRVLANAVEILAVTSKVGREIESKYELSTTTLLPGITRRSFNPYSERDNVLLTVSFWDRGRFPEVYISLIELIEDYNLVIAGNWRDNQYRDEVKTRISKSTARERIHLKENLSEENLSELYRRSKFLVRFGFDEWGPGMANIEAISHGLPIIINSSLGIADIVASDGAGFVAQGNVPPNLETNANEWYANKLSRRTENKVLLELKQIVDFVNRNDTPSSYAILQKGCELVCEKLSWKAHCDQLIRLN